ncbi:hypothetical protein RUM44_006594 [Polyplax serrata]|uniref:KN motif and ankyrin repeat domain-containing protein 1 n=1 Tax=Polyplax serrata TaxID=468196 RepID=A0ABR1AIL4_POLSC
MAEVEVHLQNGHVEDLNTRGSESKGICNCCPYGYHIDLDFVRFCEKLAKANGEPSLSKKMRRERRRQRQSMEVLLGLTKPVIWNIEQLLPSIVQENFPTTERAVTAPVVYSPLHHSNDGLNKAVLDFEATLERTSKKKKQTEGEPNSLSHHYPMDFTDGLQILMKREVSPASNDMSPFVDFEMMSMYNSGGGTSPGPLQNIREQMAISLKRMRELEEKVKLIPTLEIKVDTLKNEKYELLDNLDKLKSSLRQAKNQLNEMKKDNKNQESLINLESKPVLRDVGIGCRVLTRDVGVTPILQRSRTVGTETVPEIKNHLNGYSSPESKKLLLKSIKSQIQPDITSRSTITDLYMKDISAVLERKEKKLSQAHLDGISLIPRSVERLNKGTQASIREPVTILQVVEKREMGVQACEPKRPVRDTGITAKPKTYDVSTSLRPKTRDYGCSDDKTTDLLCDKCKNLKTRSVGVGLGNVKLEELKVEAHTAPYRSKSFQLTESKPKVTTRSIGVGTLLPVKKLTSHKGVGTHDLTGTTTRQTGTNTVKLTLVDKGLVTDKVVPEKVVCDTCKNQPKPQLKPIVTTATVGTNTTTPSTPTPLHKKNVEGTAGEHQPSKIPRPKSNQTTPVMERKKFIRQDTYTKLPPQSPSADTKKTKTRVKSTFEKLESPSEEKVDVILRKKTRPSLGQSPSGDKSLAKDLKHLSIGSTSDRYSGHFDDYYFDYDENYDDSSKRNSAMYPDHALFQPIQDESREKIKPSKEMKAAMKVVNDSLIKYPNGLPKQLKNASNIIQQEWFKISSTASANPLDVEDYLDSFDEVSSTLLEFIVNMVDNNGNTAMHYAVSHGNFDVVSILLDSKVCNINKMNAAGYTCIMLVSLAQVRSETHRQVVKRLFHLADVNIRAKQHGQTALMLAVSHGRLDMVKLLLEAGADPNIQDGDGSTALMCAAEHGHLEIVKHILGHPECDTSIVDCDGSTALAIAMEAGNRDIGVLLYAREHFSNSRGSSPYASLKQRRSKSSSSPHPRTPTSPNPNRKSDHSM